MSDPIETRDPKITIRSAGAADAGLVLGLIRELADFERLSDEVVADEEGLRRSLFGDPRVAEVLIADYEGRAAGFALFFHNFSTFLGRPGIYLEDLYVKPASRGRGIGGMLLAYLGQLAIERGCGRLEWSVLDWNEAAIGFYERLGAQSMKEWTTYRMTGSRLTELAARFRSGVEPA